MSKPSKFPQRPSSIIVQRQKSNMLMTCPDEQKLTRQLSNFSVEGYHGGKSASVPFVWESQPGTPKVEFRENSLPPLTPPPSYYQTANERPTTIKAKKNSKKGNLLQTIFPKRAARKGRVPPPPESPSLPYSSGSLSSSLSSSSPRPTTYSVPSSPMIHSRKDEEDEKDLNDVHGSDFCFGNARSRGFYSSTMKKVLLGDFL